MCFWEFLGIFDAISHNNYKMSINFSLVGFVFVENVNNTHTALLLVVNVLLLFLMLHCCWFIGGFNHGHRTMMMTKIYQEQENGEIKYCKVSYLAIFEVQIAFKLEQI